MNSIPEAGEAVLRWLFLTIAMVVIFVVTMAIVVIMFFESLIRRRKGIA